MRDVHAQLVVFDIDGTLLDTDNPISEVTVRALRDLQQRQLQIAFASSRPIASVDLLAQRVAVAAHLIGFNGAVAVSAGGRRLVAETFVMNARLAELLHRFADAGGLVNVYRPDHWLAVGPTASIDHEEKATGLAADSRSVAADLSDLAGDAVLKVMCRGGEAACNELVAAVSGSDGLVAMSAGWDCCDIQAGGVDKARAVRELCHHLDISPDAVVAFGDSDSDASMLALVGYGVAVGAASARAKEAARELIGGPGSGALAAWVDRITAVG
ncbi:HAD-IIB family hydrolase [Mycobacterium sp.]|uniref:HAD-IIB family hydrolase n=1 Tax=Mycobacterium sp. TaxID=1785 RepID=UPI0031D0BF14